VVDTSPTLVTPNIGVATGTSLAAALNGSLGATTPSTVAATTISSTTGANFATSSGNVGIGTASPSAKLDVSVGDGGAVLQLSRTGAFPASLQLNYGSARPNIVYTDGTVLTISDLATNTAQKDLRLGLGHYTNSEEPMGLIFGASGATTNVLSIGGGTSVVNAATEVAIFAAANNTTVTGTKIGSFTSTGLNSTAIGATTPSTVAATTISGTTGTFTGIVTIGGTAQLTGSAPKLEIYHGTAVKANISGTDVLSVSSTGAAITGALSATGLVTLQQTASSTTDVEYIKFNGSGENLGYLSWNNAFGNLARINGTKLGGGASADEGRLIFSVATNSVLSAVAEINPTGLDVTGTTTSSSDVIISSGNYLRLNNTANSGFASINFDGTNVTSNYGVAITGTLSATSTQELTPRRPRI
jgi:hypothetical protein